MYHAHTRDIFQVQAILVYVTLVYVTLIRGLDPTTCIWLVSTLYLEQSWIHCIYSVSEHNFYVSTI